MGDKFLEIQMDVRKTMCTNSGELTRKEGERKFSMNQNLTVLFVFLKTLKTMIPTKRFQGESDNVELGSLQI